MVRDADPTSAGAWGTGALFVAAFAAVLASFPARNADLWKHLAAGRDLVAGAAGPGPTWLADLVGYAVYRVGGGVGLVAVKAAAVAALAVLTLRTSRAGAGGLTAAACTVLAVLAAGNRLLVQPATASYLLLAVTVWLLRRDDRAGGWPGWPLAAVFLVWANVDRWVLVGLGAVALTWLGRGLDGRPGGGRYLLGRARAVAVLAGVALLNPAHLDGFPLPAELAGRALTSAVDRAYLQAFRDSPAALALYPLFGLGLVSFLIAPRWRWARFLPWAGLAALAGVQVRAAPFFAVVAGPVLAWNLHDFLAARPARRPAGPAARAAGRAAVALLGVGLLAVAWPGWLQGQPFGPRRWGVETPAAAERGAAAVRELTARGVFPPGTRTLHLSADTAAGFAWFNPGDDGVVSPDLAAAAVAGPEADDRVRAAGVSRVAVAAADRGGPGGAAFEALLADPGRWPLLHLDGGLAVFGWRDPARPDPFGGREVDLDRVGYRPADAEKAPAARSGPGAVRKWWEAFWKPAPARSPDRDQAAALVALADAARRQAPVRQVAGWEAAQAVGLVGAAGAWAGPQAAADAAVRATALRPPAPEGWAPGDPVPPVTADVTGLYRRYAAAQGDVPPGVLYAAVRAARRAVAADPTDAAAHLSLGQAYLRLLGTTREREWGGRVRQLGRGRQVQAVAALTRAAALNPGLAPAHLDLGRLLQQLGCLDLSLAHLRAYREAAARQGRGGAAADAVPDAELARLAEAVADRERQVATEAGRARVGDRAALAARLGLGGKARDLLLESDVSAFGTQGTELELDLLLRTGRPDDVIAWVTPEVGGSLGPAPYRWVRAQALLAAGEYAEADAELADLVGSVPPADTVAAALGTLAGRLVLHDMPAGVGFGRLMFGAVGRSEFTAGVGDLGQGLVAQADAAVVRGVAALEAGEVDRAREAFRAALAFAPAAGDPGGFAFPAHQVARDALGWLDAPGR